jgi:hypothetical protein
MLRFASRFASGSPAQSSSAVNRAIDSAASTVAASAAGEKSELLAWPRRWPQIHRDAQALVAVVFDGFHFLSAHADGLSETFRDVDFAGAGPACRRMVESGLGEFAQGGLSVSEAIGHAGTPVKAKL